MVLGPTGVNVNTGAPIQFPDGYVGVANSKVTGLQEEPGLIFAGAGIAREAGEIGVEAAGEGVSSWFQYLFRPGSVIRASGIVCLFGSGGYWFTGSSREQRLHGTFCGIASRAPKQMAVNKQRAEPRPCPGCCVFDTAYYKLTPRAFARIASACVTRS